MSRPIRTVIHVNQHKIRANAKQAEPEPVITVKTYKANKYAFEAKILNKDGDECAKVVYRPDKPLSCGAKVWIETYNQVVTDEDVK